MTDSDSGASSPAGAQETAGAEAPEAEAWGAEASGAEASGAEAHAAAASPAAPAAAKRTPAEVLPLIGGRLGLGVAFLVGISLVAPQNVNAWLDRLLHPAPVKATATWEVGKEALVELTLITADARRLNCAHDQVLQGQHCGFTANKHAWPRAPGELADDNDHDVIQPYRTADTNALILVSGVWAQPEVALRLHREPPNHYDVKKQVRFVAYCQVRFLGELEHLSLRWETGGKWLPEGKALVAQAQSCTLEPPTG